MRTRKLKQGDTSLPPKERKVSQRDLAYGVIRRSILLGHQKHGSKINERILAEKLGISRVPVREALLCLHGEGLIRKSNRGLEVTRLSPEEILFQVEFRVIMECAAVRLAAERITRPEVDRLLELIDEQAILERAKDADAFRESDLAFHQLLLKATKNPFIIRLSGTLAMGLILGKVEHGGVVDGHRRILEAVRLGNPDQAEQLMYDHIANSDIRTDTATGSLETSAG